MTALEHMGSPVSNQHRRTEAASATHRLRTVLGSIRLDSYALVGDALAVVLAVLVLQLAAPVWTGAAVVIALGLAGTHHERLTLSALEVLPRMTAAVVVAVTAIELVWSRFDSLLSVAQAMAGIVLAVGVGRALAYAVERRARRDVARRHRTMVVGAGELGAALASAMIDRPECGLEPVVLVDDDPTGDAAMIRVPIVPVGANLRQVLDQERIDRAVIAYSRIPDHEMVDLLREGDRLDCEIYVVPRLWEMTAVTGEMDRIGTIPLTRIRRSAHRTVSWQAKLLLARALGAGLFGLLAPLMAAIALGVFLTDRSAPILFRQTRVGMDGRKFEVLKFRSMRPANELESATNWNIATDARVGRFGRFLRATSLDELPQLWNVVRGEMVLIGPRPERPHFVDEFSATVPRYRARHRVPAGLTGYAAVSGLRGDTSIPERARHDNFYIENWSLWFDVKVALRTLVALLPTQLR